MSSLFTTVVELVKLGALGIGGIALLLGYLLATQTSAVDPAIVKFRTHFLWFAFAYAFAAALIGLVPLFVNRAGPMSERLAFSPDFDSEKLPSPTIRLPDGTEAKHNAKFNLEPSSGTQVVTVSMDATLNQVRNLKEASANVTSALGRVSKQRDALAARAVALKPTAEAQPKTPALQALQLNSANVDAIREAFAKSINSGDYARANQLTFRLNSSAVAAEPAVAKITQPQSQTNPH